MWSQQWWDCQPLTFGGRRRLCAKDIRGQQRSEVIFVYLWIFFFSKIRQKRLLVDALLQVYREHLLIGPEEQRGKHLPLPSPQAVRGLNINSLLARQESSTSSGAVCIRLSLDYTFLLLLLHLFYPLSSVITIIIITCPLESCGSINLWKVVMLLPTTNVKKNLEDQSLSLFFRYFSDLIGCWGVQQVLCVTVSTAFLFHAERSYLTALNEETILHS